MVDANIPQLPGPPRKLRRPDSLQKPAPATPEPVKRVETIKGEPVTEEQIQAWADEAEQGYDHGQFTGEKVATSADPVDRLAALPEMNTGIVPTSDSAKPSPFNTPVTGSTPAGVPPLSNEDAAVPTPEPTFDEVVTRTETVGTEAPLTQEKKSLSRGFLVTLVVLAVALVVAAGAYLALTAVPGLFGAATPTVQQSAPAAPTVTEETPAESPAATEEVKEEVDKPIRTVEGAEPELLQMAPTAGTEQDAAWDALFPELAVTTINPDEGRWISAETCRRLSEGETAETLTTWLAGLNADTAEVGKVAEAGVATFCTDQTPALLSAFETVGLI